MFLPGGDFDGGDETCVFRLGNVRHPRECGRRFPRATLGQDARLGTAIRSIETFSTRECIYRIRESLSRIPNVT